MPKVFRFHFHVDQQGAPDVEATPEAIRAMLRTVEAAAPDLPTKSWSFETAARSFAESFLGVRKESVLRDITAPGRAEVVPDLRLEADEDSPLTHTRVMQFSQSSRSVPIFGTKTTVEVDGSDRRLVSIDATLTDIPDVSAIAELSAAEALSVIADYCGVPIEKLSETAAPEMNFFADDKKDRWHLVYYFKEVPAVPPEEAEEESVGHGLGPSPRKEFATYDFLVDAHDGEIVFFFSSNPDLDVPTRCHGIDERNLDREFHGLHTGHDFHLKDPLRRIETYDHQRRDITHAPLPNIPIRHGQTDFGSSHTAGVSAHYHATKVFDFFNDVLKRNGIDGKGMSVVSLVNCTYSAHEPPPNWRNAVWWQNKMWYGQVQNAGGDFESYARYLDVIAHELTHGVTGTTSKLVYRDQSGALNESFSDIFGVMVNNWYPGQPNPLGNWNWEIGSGLKPGGMPLRDMSSPSRTGDPAHMNDYLQTAADHGGVHSNSNIHNKAAYNMITARDQDGNFVFTPEESAILFYLTLTRLSRMANFSDCLRVLKSVARTYYSGDPVEQSAKCLAIEDAYKAVGIV